MEDTNTYTCRECGVECLDHGCSLHPKAGVFTYPRQPIALPKRNKRDGVQKPKQKATK